MLLGSSPALRAQGLVGEAPEAPAAMPIRVPLGSAAAYGLLSGGSIAAQDVSGSSLPESVAKTTTAAVDIPVQVLGRAGATQSIGALVTATAGRFAQGSGTVPQALADLRAAQAYCTNRGGTAIAAQLGGQTLTGGAYTVGNGLGEGATLGSGSTLTLSGDTATRIVLTIGDNLTVAAGSRVVLQGVLPRHVYWNIGGALSVGDGVGFKGVALVSGGAVVDGIQLGNYAILSSSEIVLTHILQAIGHNRFYAPAKALASACTGSVACSFPLPGSELIQDGSFEYYQQLPDELGQLVEDMGSQSVACFWQAGTEGTADYFHALSTPCAPLVGVPNNIFSAQNYITRIPVNALAQNSQSQTGQAYAGLYAYAHIGYPDFVYREYVRQLGAGTLQPGKRYYGEFSACISPSSGNTVPQLGMAIVGQGAGSYPAPATPYGLVPLAPTVVGTPNQATAGATVPVGWQQVGQVFTNTVAGPFTVLIGNFNDNTAITANGPSKATIAGSNSFSDAAYYYIDNVTLSPLTEAGPDVVLGDVCAGTAGPTSTTLGTAPMPTMVGATYRWTSLPSGFTSTDPNPVVSPAATTTYYLAVTIPGQAAPYTSQAIVKVNAPYGQTAGATYVAPAGLAAYEIGTAGTVTTIDANAAPYNGTVIFSGTYHVRGSVRLVSSGSQKGSFQLLAGTRFLIDGGPDNYGYVQDSDPVLPKLVVQNATLSLAGATLQASCSGGPRWGGLLLNGQAALRTAASGSTRSLIRDAYQGVGSSAGNAYYLADTDFRNNLCGLYEYVHGKEALPYEGIRNCTFSGGDYGLLLAEQDDISPNRGGDYDAATFSGNTFSAMTFFGMLVQAGNSNFTNNTFSTCGVAAIGSDGGDMGLAEISHNTIYVPAASANPTQLPGARYGAIGIEASPRTNVNNNTIIGEATGAPASGPLTSGVFLYPNTQAISGSGVVDENTIRNLDEGITAFTSDYVNGSCFARGNTFIDNATSLSVYQTSGYQPNSTRVPIPNTVTFQCSSFINDAASRFANPAGIWFMDRANVKGLETLPNGNAFSGVAVKRRVINDDSKNTGLVYKRYNVLAEELDADIRNSQDIKAGDVIRDFSSPSSTSSTCNGYTAGVHRMAPAPTGLSVAALEAKLDSLQAPALPAAQQQRLLLAIVAQPAQPAQLAALATYLATAAPAPTLGYYLLQGYQAQHDQANAGRVRAWLRQHSAADDAEQLSYLRLDEVVGHLGGSLPSTLPLTAADRATLRQLATSGTAAARLACRLLRHAEPACACVLPPASAPKATATPARPLATPASRVVALSAYPNPASTTLRVPFTLPATPAGAELRAYDAQGRLVWHQALTAGQGEVTLSVQGWAPGLYQLTLTGNRQVLGSQRVAIIPQP